VRRIAVLAAVLALAACGGEPTEEPVRTNRVELPKSYRFEPPVIQVSPGTTVTWVNQDDFPHTVHLLDGSGVDEPLPVGESISIPFEDPGRVEYECSLHPQMHGTVIVR
jgi:plastocyanin